MNQLLFDASIKIVKYIQSNNYNKLNKMNCLERVSEEYIINTLKDVTTMVTAARSRLIRFTFIIQNFAQLTQVYGKENGDTIRGNCNLLYLISSEIAALEEISKMCGEVKSKEKDKTASTPLVTVSDLQRLSQFEIIVLRRRMFPYKTKFQTDFQVDWGRTYPKSTPEARPKRELQLFDIREFVKAKKQEKMASMGEFSPNMSNPFISSSNPFMGGSPFGSSNPFAGPSSNPFSGGMPAFLGNQGQSEPEEDSFNIDDLVKKIDAKIAEIEKEEEQTKEPEQVQKPVDVVSEPVTQSTEKENVSFNDLTQSNQSIPAPKENNTNEDKLQNMYTDNTNDDDFFDDFFSDD